MKVVSCEPGQMSVSPEQFNACTFNIIDKWDPKQHAKTCDTMFYLRDGTGAYVWDCDKWIFLDFTGYTAPDWNASENQQGYIKNKPFQTLGNGLTVSEEGVLSVNVTPKDIGAASTEDLNEHINDTKNPHKVTAGQTGAFTKEESSANVIYQIIGKKSVEWTITLDTRGKVKGSVVENPNILTGGSYPYVTNPINSRTEMDQQVYDQTAILDGNILEWRIGSNGNRAAIYDKWNVLEVLIRTLGEGFFRDRGAIELPKKIEVMKNILTEIKPATWGYGSSPAGNKLSYQVWINNSSWDGAIKNNTSSLQKLEYISTGTATNNYISEDGFLYAVSYAEPSNGVVPSVVNRDYSNLEIKIRLSMNEHIKLMMAAYHGENPPEWSEVTEKPFETIGDNLEVVGGKLNALGGIAASQIEVNEGNIPDKYISPKTLAGWESEQLLKRGKQMVLGENRQLESPSDMNFGKFGISDNYKAGTFKNEQPYFTVDEAGDVTVVKAGQYLISGICKRQYKRLVSIWHYISLIHKDVTSGNETQLDLFPLGGSVQNRNKQYGQTVRQCKVGDKIWMSSTSSAGPGNANADALQYLNVDFFTMERLGD